MLLKTGGTFIVLAYVDDLIIARDDPVNIDKLKKFLNHCFRIRDLGLLRYFLRIEISQFPSGIFLNQRKYTLNILKETGMLGFRPSSFPMEQQHHLGPDSGPPIPHPYQYRHLIGRLIYLTVTGPEITYAVHIVSQLMSDPRQQHLDAAMHVLRYLKSSPEHGVFFSSKSDILIRGYCDSDWASCPLTRWSTIGYFTTLGSTPLSWKSKKQPTVSRSFTEAEYRSMAAATNELL
ncbi:PREDICTED: uncharacterized protein LOC109115656 [Nelumbo nucifera]|uniref:Uncharacterized protein LOC109115656 n=1 Tax=Nelumbo nucifera TaxID=4432 RepID=A0A1U8QBD2_NELNU|nr:PREDICTED: uncharacterized protein LOC109115656 [Nelumbo nucifera]